MRISLSIFWLPKRGNSAAEYEDAFWPRESVDLDSDLFRFAVADGATETSFAGAWARILARAYCKDQFSPRKIRKSLPRLQQEWYSSFETAALPWYAEQKLRQGAYATLLGLTMYRGRLSSDLLWTSTAIGDSCLFQLRSGQLVTSFPLAHSDAFNNRPPLMSSQQGNWNDEVGAVAHTQGAWQSSDVFYLMTDAIACWFLRACERGEQPAGRIETMADAAAFGTWVESLRDLGEMRNDDVTILRVRAV